MTTHQVTFQPHDKTIPVEDGERLIPSGLLKRPFWETPAPLESLFFTLRLA